MNSNQHSAVCIVADLLQPNGVSAAVFDLVNEVCDDQRRNDAEAFASRLEVLASYVIRHEMNTVEAVEALRVEANLIRNELWGAY